MKNRDLIPILGAFALAVSWGAAVQARDTREVLKIGILYFENRISPQSVNSAHVGLHSVDPEFDYLEKALTDMLSVDLAAFSGIQVLERSKIEKLREEISLGVSGLIDEKTAAKLGKAAEGDFLIYGQIDRKKEELVVRVKIADIATGKIHSLKESAGPEEDIFVIAENLGNTISDFLGKTDKKSPRTPGAKCEDAGNLAVLPFFNNSKAKRFDHLGRGLAEIFSSELASERRFTVIERVWIDKIVKELGLQQTGIVDEKTAVKAGKLLGAKYLLFGTFMESQGVFRLDIRLVEVETGRTSALASAREKQDRLPGAAALLIERISCKKNATETLKGGRDGSV